MYEVIQCRKDKSAVNYELMEEEPTRITSLHYEQKSIEGKAFLWELPDHDPWFRLVL
jgi:hypothetical protein